jgi:hypothetical protein
MLLVRRYKKLGWWDLLDQIDLQLKESPEKEVYIEILDELRMRLLESVSEGASFKLKAPAERIINEFKVRMDSDDNFANSSDFKEVQELADFILN